MVLTPTMSRNTKEERGIPELGDAWISAFPLAHGLWAPPDSLGEDPPPGGGTSALCALEGVPWYSCWL
jgi:hypothetical protein